MFESNCFFVFCLPNYGQELELDDEAVAKLRKEAPLGLTLAISCTGLTANRLPQCLPIITKQAAPQSEALC